MKSIKNIDYFKVAILICSVIFLFLFQDFSKNGRYQKSGESSVIDTRTGNVYWLSVDKILEYEHPVIPRKLRDN